MLIEGRLKKIEMISRRHQTNLKYAKTRCEAIVKEFSRAKCKHT